MKFLWDSAFGLLLVTGALLGLTLPFGKIATGSGVPPILWAFVISCGAGGVLLVALLVRRHRFELTAQKLRYFVIAAAISYAIPNLLMFSAIPHLGAGYTGIMFTLSPVITLVLSILLGVRRPNLLGIAGIAVGFVGALMVAVTRGEAGQPAALFWVVIGLLIPVSLAAGNIYRTFDWPENTGPIELAVGSHLAAAAMLLVGLLFLEGIGTFSHLSGMPLLVVAQIASASAMFVFFFRLQAVGGPVYLSQIGYVGAADRADFRHAGARRALPVADLARRGHHHRRHRHDDQGAKPERLTAAGSALSPDGQIGGRGQRGRQLRQGVAQAVEARASRSPTIHLRWHAASSGRSVRVPRTVSRQNCSTFSTVMPCVTASMRTSANPASRISASKIALSSSPDGGPALAPARRRAAARQRWCASRAIGWPAPSSTPAPVRRGQERGEARQILCRDRGRTSGRTSRCRGRSSHRRMAAPDRRRSTISTLAALAAATLRRSSSSIAVEKSTAVTWRTAGARMSVVVPGPQAMSIALVVLS